jgi:hypothetical protein
MSQWDHHWLVPFVSENYGWSLFLITVRLFNYVDCISAALAVNRGHHTRAQSLTELCLPRHRTVSIVRFQGHF